MHEVLSYRCFLSLFQTLTFSTVLGHHFAAGSIRPSPYRAPSHHSSTSYKSSASKDTVRQGDLRQRSGTAMSYATTTSDRSRSRRERTFVGSECAVCEEPLEHTLRGERILQFSCSHVSHEACFYEFIREFESQYCPSCNAPLHLDTSRGGNVLDIGKESKFRAYRGNGHTDSVGLPAEKITNMVRSASSGENRSLHTPTPSGAQWESQGRPPSGESAGRSMPSNGRESAARGSARDGSERYAGSSSRHGRSDSEATGVASSTGYPETMQSGPPRRHDYDLQAMETTPGSPRPVTRNPIPAPSVAVRSEFPTINRSRQQQTLTCLITVEVPDNKWRPDPEDLGVSSPLQPVRIEEAFTQRPPSPARSSKPRFYPYEAPEVLEEMTENLRNRVDNWHGLDFNR